MYGGGRSRRFARFGHITHFTRFQGGLVFFSFWVLLGSSGFFWCSSGVLLVFDNTEERQKNTEEHQKNPEGEEHKPPAVEVHQHHGPLPCARVFVTWPMEAMALMTLA